MRNRPTAYPVSVMLVVLSEGVSLFYSRYLAALLVKPVTTLSLTAGARVVAARGGPRAAVLLDPDGAVEALRRYHAHFPGALIGQQQATSPGCLAWKRQVERPALPTR